MIKLWVAIIILGGLLVCSGLIIVEERHISRGLATKCATAEIIAEWNSELLEIHKSKGD